MNDFSGASSRRALLLAVAGCCGSATALAAEADADAVEEIVVTAQKREQAAQDIPISLYALPGDAIERAGITSIVDLGNTLAGVNIATINPGQMRLTIRGAADVSGSNQASSVNGYYLDETAISYVPGYMPELGLWDIERVELLRGPQGTLFGEGSEGGTLRIITKKPDATQFFGRYQVGASSTSSGDNGYRALASVNVPIAKDVLAMTLAASYTDLPGWIDIPDLNKKDTNEAKTKDARVAFRYTPSEALSVDAFYLRNKIDSIDFGATSPGVLNPTAAAPGSGPVNALSPLDAKLDVAALTIAYSFGPATLVSASSYTKYGNDTERDFSAGLPLFFGDPAATGHQEYFVQSKAKSQELRLVSNGDQKLDWTIGGYYKDEDRMVNEADIFNVPAFGDLHDVMSTHSESSSKAWAVFGDIDYALTERLSAQLGLRYFSDDKKVSDVNLTSSVLFGTVAGTVVSGKGSATATSPKVGLTFAVSPDVLLFAKVAEGFRSGGANEVPIVTYPYANSAYDSESLRSYEVGVKTQPAAGWYFNVYAFNNDWSDLQLAFSTTDNIWGYTDNAGSATSKGAEVEIEGHVATGLMLGLTYSYTDSTIDSDVFNQAGNLVAQGGNRIPQSPKSKVAFTTSYTAPLSGSLDGNITGRYRQASGFYSDASNDPSRFNGKSKQLYLGLGVEGKWGSLNLYGDNLLDRNDTTANFKPIGALPYVFVNYVRPRNFGIEYRGKF